MQINTFTNKPFKGNPAAVCYIPYERNDEWFKLIAKEFNLPATAFVVKRRPSKSPRLSEGGGSPLIAVDETGNDLKSVKRNTAPIENEFDIRWFTTNSEVCYNRNDWDLKVHISVLSQDQNITVKFC